MQDMEKPVIVVAFNGTADASAMADLAAIDAKIGSRFPAHEVRWALTSPFMIRHLKKLGIEAIFPPSAGRGAEQIQGLPDLYSELAAAGKSDAVVLLLMVHECGASQDIYALPTAGLNLRFVKPLMSHEYNVDTLVEAMAYQFGGTGTANVLVGHGNLKEFDLNDSFGFMAEYVKEHYPNVFVATLHGPPGTDAAIAAARASGAKETLFLPLMIISGGHINDDVMAETPESWKNRIGLPARAGESFSKNDKVMEMYLRGISEQLAGFTAE
jgi:cobalamin biosynthesis Co2+ chelatase CbiK